MFVHGAFNTAAEKTVVNLICPFKDNFRNEFLVFYKEIPHANWLFLRSCS